MAGLLAAARRASGIPVRPRAVQQDDTLTGPMESSETTRHGRAASRPSRARRGCARRCAVLRSSDGCFSVRRRPARILTVIVGNPGLRRSIDRLSSSCGRLKEDAMRSIVLGAIVAAGLSLVSAVPTVSAPANVAAIGQAAADIGTVSQVRCWCTWRGWRGYCRRWRCW